jgi:hypothetical protein
MTKDFKYTVNIDLVSIKSTLFSKSHLSLFTENQSYARLRHQEVIL